MANNINGGAPNAVVAKLTVSFATAGITALNTEIIYLVDNPLKSYVPGRAINGISGFEEGKGYYLVAKIDMDLESVLIPPIPGGGDTTAPTIVSATATNATTIVIVFSEAVITTGVNGWSFNNGGAITPSAVSGSGTNTLTFTVTGLAAGQTITRTYNQSTGDTRDAATNELAAFTNGAVTNSVPGGPTFLAWDNISGSQNEQFNSNQGIRKQSSPNGALPTTTWSTTQVSDGEMMEFIYENVSAVSENIWFAKTQSEAASVCDLGASMNTGILPFAKNTGLTTTKSAVNGDKVQIMYKAGRLVMSHSSDGTEWTCIYDSFIDPITAYYVAFVSGVNGLGTSEIYKKTATQAPVRSFRAIVQAGGTQVNLTWDALSGATGYTVQRATNATFTTGLTTVYTGSGTSFNDTGVSNSTTYYFRIRATGSSNSPWYIQQVATTTAGDVQYINWSVAGTRAEPTQDYKGIRETLGFSAGDAAYAHSSTAQVTSGNSFVFKIDNTGTNTFTFSLSPNNSTDPNSATIAVNLSGTIAVLEGGSVVSSGNSTSVNDLWRIVRKADNTFTVEKSTNSGASWSVIYTSALAASGSYYVGFKPFAEGFGSPVTYIIPE